MEVGVHTYDVCLSACASLRCGAGTLGDKSSTEPSGGGTPRDVTSSSSWWTRMRYGRGPHVLCWDGQRRGGGKSWVPSASSTVQRTAGCLLACTTTPDHGRTHVLVTAAGTDPRGKERTASPAGEQVGVWWYLMLRGHASPSSSLLADTCPTPMLHAQGPGHNPPTHLRQQD